MTNRTVKRSVPDIKKSRYKKGTPVSEKEREIMLFWYTVFDGNFNRIANKVSAITGIKRSRKVVMEVSQRFNFNVQAHVVRDQVNKKFYGDTTPGMSRIMKQVIDMLEIDENLLKHGKRFLQGDSQAKVKNITELLNVLKHVKEDAKNLTGIKDIKNTAFNQMSERIEPAISYTIDEIMRDMDANEKADLLGEVVESQVQKILSEDPVNK